MAPSLYTRVGADPSLFALYKRIAREQGDQLSGSHRKALQDNLRDLRLSGAELQADVKELFVASSQRSAELSREFSNHLLDAKIGRAHV